MKFVCCFSFHLFATLPRSYGHGVQVGWLRAADQTVLALQDRVVTHNARISVSHENYLTWRLRIKQLRETDKGCYMCQINSSPMKKQIGCIDVQSEYTHDIQYTLDFYVRLFGCSRHTGRACVGVCVLRLSYLLYREP